MDAVDWQAGAAVASAMDADGRSLDAIAARLIAAGLGPLATYRALRAGTGTDYGTAKECMHRNLPESVQRAAQALWDRAEEELRAELDG